MKTALPLIFVLGAMFLITGCGCLTPPPDDSTAPKTSVSVISYNESGQEVIQSISSEDEGDSSLKIPKGWSFQVVYTADDEGGVKSLRIEDGINGDTAEVLSFEEVSNGEADFSSCPKRYQSITTYYNGQEEVSEYKFRAIGTDFNGNESQTPAIIVTLDG